MSVTHSANRLRWLAVAAIALSGGACEGPGNTGQPMPDPLLVQQVPWLNGVLPALAKDGTYIGPQMAVYPAIASGMPDLGSQRTDCTQLGNYTFSAGWMETFELTGTIPNETGVASGWSSYDDLTKDSFHVPGDATWYPALMGTIAALWGMPAEQTPGPSCDNKPNDWVMHFRGGLFRKWGGGVSHAFTDPVGRFRPSPMDMCPATADFCPAPLPENATVDSAGLPTKAANGAELAQSHDFFDVASYDGVAFWARRGPEGSDQLQVILTDKFTSSRLARENQKYCRRIRECHTKCLSGAPCSPTVDPTSPTPIYRCFDPAQGPLPLVAIDSELDLMYPRCGVSACTSPTTYIDPDFDGKDCRPYSFPAADESGEYCWNEGDTPPPSRDDRCQDGWTTVIQLSPDWKFYALPFSQFSQVGFGKRAQYMDLKSLDTIAFGTNLGWADSFFDNVTFYRVKK
ncbi:MAG TPA: hypothetical protein VH374_20890 [Polyangia bacterium]|nr:hypothetical protein [Polyangia bacterium]